MCVDVLVCCAGATGGAFRLSWGVMPTLGGTVLGLLVRFVALLAAKFYLNVCLSVLLV